jgi:hypothetical protein
MRFASLFLAVRVVTTAENAGSNTFDVVLLSQWVPKQVKSTTCAIRKKQWSFAINE